jgi:hypothetical protein
MDITTIFGLVAVVINLGGLFVMVVVKFNDLKHLQQQVRDIKECIKDIKDKLINFESRISRIEGKLCGK